MPVLSDADLRILGVSLPDVSDFSEAVPSGKWSQFFGALARRYNLVGVVRPQLSRRDHYFNLAGAVHPRRGRWRARAGFSKARFMKRTEAVARGLTRYQDSYDLIVQMQTLCAPSFDLGTIPYAIYTDSTMALTQRFYPAGARLSRAAANEWMQLEASVCTGASVVFTLSEFARRSVIDDYGCASDRVVSVGSGANQLLSELNDDGSAPARALFVGVDFERKGGQVLLEAWGIVSRHVADAELIIAGPRRSPVTTGLRGVRWVGRINRDALAALYKSSRVFVMPSLFEPWGFAFLEAMGHGLPCVGSSCCAMPEIIADGITGQLVPPGEAEPLAAALMELLTQPRKAAEMGRAAHERVLSQYGWSDVIDRMAMHLRVGSA